MYYPGYFVKKLYTASDPHYHSNCFEICTYIRNNHIMDKYMHILYHLLYSEYCNHSSVIPDFICVEFEQFLNQRAMVDVSQQPSRPRPQMQNPEEDEGLFAL